MTNILKEEFFKFLKEFKPIKGLKSNDFTKKFENALESDLKYEFNTLHKNIVERIPDALPFSQQNPDMISKGIIKLKKNKYFIVNSIRPFNDTKKLKSIKFNNSFARISITIGIV